jgi:hypothetical protein
LLNDRGSTGTAWFATASHCQITSQAIASNLQFFWYYELGCGTGTVNPSSATTFGAQYLLWDKSIDFSFLKVLGTLPSGLRLLGWNPNPVAPGTAVFGVHHPAGFYKAESEGTSATIVPVSFTEFGQLFHVSTTTVNWSLGITEPGSSGSPLMSFDGAVRGTLSAGPATATCSAPVAYYAQFSDAYQKIKNWIDPTAGITVAHTAAQTSSTQSGPYTSTVQLGLLSTSSDQNWFRFAFPVTGYWLFGTTFVSGGSVDTVGNLYASDATTVLDSNDNDPTGSLGTNFLLFGHVTKPNTFYVEVTGKNGATGPYALYSLFEPDDPDGHGGFPWLGTPLSPTGSDTGSIVRAGDIDYFIIDLPSAGTLTLQSTGGTDVTGFLFDSNLNQIDTNDDISGTNLNFRMQDTLSAGRYYLAINGYDVTVRGDYGITSTFASSAPNTSYEGLWWKSPAGSESGWGVNITHQGDILFATWFTYDIDGSGMWLVMSNGAKVGQSTYSGTLYRTIGPSFAAAPWNPSQVSATAVGSATFSFSDPNNGTFAYTVNGISQSKSITRQVYATPVPTCVESSTQAPTANYQDLWWRSPGGSESGWGVNITHQGNILFATVFTYDATGKGMWLVMSNGAKTAPSVYSGALYRTTGPAFNASPWNPSAVTATTVGTGTFFFSDSNNATFTYTVNGTTVTKSITRQIYSSPPTVCQ